MTEPSEQASNAVRAALRAEHAALWMYGLASAFATESRVLTAIEDAMNTHRQQRDQAQRLIEQSGERAPAAMAAYQPSAEITDQTSAIRQLIVTEEDCQIGWRSVLDTTEDRRWRESALAGLTASATRATRWRITIDQQPAAPSFPGDPG